MFEVACVCGKKMLVRSGQAGSTIPCSCGQPVAVPSLGQLRKAALNQGRSIEKPPIKHDWRAWWTGIILVVSGYGSQIIGTIVAINRQYPDLVFIGGVLIGLGYIMVSIGILVVGVGKGMSMGFCLLMAFVIPLGFFAVLFVPGKGTDRDERFVEDEG